MKKVLIITYYWPPSGGGGVQRWVKFVKYLPKLSIEPIVLTVKPDVASYAVLDESLLNEVSENTEVVNTKSFEPFNVYKAFSKKKEIPFAGFANEESPGVFQKLSRFVRGNFFIPDARIGWNKFAYKQAVRLIKKHNIQTVITSSPPHSTQLIGLKLKKNFNINWIADLRDPWTDIYYYNRLYHTSIAKQLDKKKETKVLNEADKIIVVSKSIKALFASKIKNKETNKISIIPNGFDDDDFDFSTNTNTKEFVITYTGTIADNYHIEGFLNSVIKLVNKHKGIKIKLQFVGRVSQKYHEIIKNSTLEPISVFVGHVDHNTSIRYLKESNALFLAIPDEKLNEGILTGKLFEYLAVRKPIIGTGPTNGDASTIINECNAGRMFLYEDEDNITKYLNELLLEWDGLTYPNIESKTYKKYSRERLTELLTDLIQ